MQERVPKKQNTDPWPVGATSTVRQGGEDGEDEESLRLQNDKEKDGLRRYSSEPMRLRETESAADAQPQWQPPFRTLSQHILTGGTILISIQCITVSFLSLC